MSYPQTTLECSPPGSAIGGKLTHQPDPLSTAKGHSPKPIRTFTQTLEGFLNESFDAGSWILDPGALAGSLVALPALPDRCPLVIEPSKHSQAQPTWLEFWPRFGCRVGDFDQIWKIHENPESDII